MVGDTILSIFGNYSLQHEGLGIEEVGRKTHTCVALIICWRVPITSTTELYRKNCVISFHFRQEKTYLAKVFLYTQDRCFTNVTGSPSCLQCIIISISHRNKGEITWSWLEGGRTKIQSQVSLHLAHLTL